VSIVVDANGIPFALSEDGTALALNAPGPASIVDSMLGPGVPHGWTRVAVTDSDVQDIDITFDGEAGLVFEAMGLFTNNNAEDATYTIQPNQVSTNQKSQDTESTPAGAASGFSSNNLAIGYAKASGGKCSLSFRMATKTGDMRWLHGAYDQISAVPAIVNHGNVGEFWNDTSTAITSLRLHCDKSAGFKVGSYIYWRAMPLAA
jgi:hypothetical protein